MFSILKFLSGFNIFNGEKLGKLVFYAIIFIIGIGIYHKTFIAKTQTTQIKTEKVIYYQECPQKDRFIGMKVWRFGIGINY